MVLDREPDAGRKQMPEADEEGSAVFAEYVGPGRFQTRISVNDIGFITDEPVAVGGDASGPTPYELLSAALAACTSMTMRLYAERRKWELPPFRVEVAHSGPTADRTRDRFERRIVISGDIDPVRREKLLDIAGRCPVHKTLMRGFEILSSVAPVELPDAGEPAAQHQRDMEAACAE
jgi:putative redox protein